MDCRVPAFVSGKVQCCACGAAGRRAWWRRYSSFSGLVVTFVHADGMLMRVLVAFSAIGGGGVSLALGRLARTIKPRPAGMWNQTSNESHPKKKANR
jgi:hypothetical protein